MSEPLPRVVSFEPFLNVGFYRLMSLRQCIFKAMSTNLSLICPLPEEPPTRATLVGRFHHRVMNFASYCTSVEELEFNIENQIVELQKEVDVYLTARRLGSVSGWPEVNRSATASLKWFGDRTPSAQGIDVSSELELRSRSNLFTGRADYVRRMKKSAELIDFKSSSLVDAAGKPKKEYLDQLFFYSSLLFDQYELDEIYCTLRSLSAEAFSWTVSREEGARFLEVATNDLKIANRRVESAAVIEDLESPSTAACTYCNKKPICLGFQREQYNLGLLGADFVVSGRVESMKVDSGIQCGIEVREVGSLVKRELRIPLTKIENIKVGDEITVTALRLRDNVLYGEATSNVYAH